jgi:hypothetical protein
LEKNDRAAHHKQTNTGCGTTQAKRAEAKAHPSHANNSAVLERRGLQQQRANEDKRSAVPSRTHHINSTAGAIRNILKPQQQQKRSLLTNCRVFYFCFCFILFGSVERS